jgi:hypothetical protein
MESLPTLQYHYLTCRSRRTGPTGCHGRDLLLVGCSGERNEVDAEFFCASTITLDHWKYTIAECVSNKNILKDNQRLLQVREDLSETATNLCGSQIFDLGNLISC